MDDLSHRTWANRYNSRLHGALNRYLLGHQTLEEALMAIVEDLYQKRDLTLIHAQLDRALKDLTEDPEFKVSADFLEQVQEMIETKMAKREPERTVEVPLGYGILSDGDIRALALDGMIEPFSDRQVVRTEEKARISHGLSSYGYDARVAGDFKVFTNLNSTEVDPKAFDPASFVDVRANEQGFIRIPPNSFVLGHTVERFRIPRDVLVICLGKSTYARCGIIVNVTPLEPEWEGHVTLEFSNTTPLPARLYANEGACQFLFLRGSKPCEVSYRDRGGKYQGQSGVTLPRMK